MTTTTLDPRAYERRWVQETIDGNGDVIGPRGTLVLEPTAAQVRAGVRMLIVDDTPCPNARKLRDAAVEHGWAAMLTRSRFLSAQVTVGDRKGRRHEVEAIAVRMTHVERSLAAYAVWLYDVERGSWSFDGAAVVAVTSWKPRVIGKPVDWPWGGGKNKIPGIMDVIKGGAGA